MSLEDILRQKAAAKEAERARQQKEQETAVSQAEKERQQQAEEIHVAGLRQSIVDIDTKTAQMQGLLSELHQSHEQARGSVAGAKTEGKELTKATGEIDKLFANEEFRALLADEGIHSIDDLMNAGDYAEHEQVKSLKGRRETHAVKRQSARAHVGARRQVKEQAHQVITAEKPDVPQKLTYKDIVVALEELVRDMGQERQKLYYQTPEGKAALKAEILDRVKQRHEARRSHNPLTSKQEINNRSTVDTGDIKDAAEYGEGEIKVALKDYYGEVIDKALDDEASRSGVPKLREAVATIDNLPKQWQEIQTNVYGLQRARKATIERLTQLLGKDKDAPLFRSIKDYGRWWTEDPAELAEAFVDSLSSNNTITLGLRMGSESPDEILQKTAVRQGNLAEQAKSGNTKGVFSRSDVKTSDDRYNYSTELENPEAVSIVLAEQAEFYKKFQAALTTPKEVLAKLKGQNDKFHDEVRPRSHYDLGLGDRGSIKSRLEFDGKTYATLRDTPLSQIRARLEQQQKETEKTAAALKEQIGSKIEADWASMELSSFNGEYNSPNYRSVHAAEKITQLQKAAEQLTPRLDLATAQLTADMDRPVSGYLERGQRFHLEFDSVKNEDLMRMAREIETLAGNIRDADSRIAAIDRRAGSEGDGLLGRKKKAREQEKAQEETKKQGYQTQLDQVQKEYQPKRDLENKLGGVHGWLYEAQQQGLEIRLPHGSVTLRELIDNVKGQMVFSITSEQSQAYERHQELEKKRDQKAKEYEKYRR